MKTGILTLALFILLSPFTNALAQSADVIDVMISSRDGNKLIGVLPDRSTVLIMCAPGLLSWGADMLFTNDDHEFTTESHGRASMAGLRASPSSYRPLSKQDATTVCSAASGHFIFKIDEHVASIASTLSSTARAGIFRRKH
jgi:hypothetical protein